MSSSQEWRSIRKAHGKIHNILLNGWLRCGLDPWLPLSAVRHVEEEGKLPFLRFLATPAVIYGVLVSSKSSSPLTMEQQPAFTLNEHRRQIHCCNGTNSPAVLPRSISAFCIQGVDQAISMHCQIDNALHVIHLEAQMERCSVERWRRERWPWIIPCNGHVSPSFLLQDAIFKPFLLVSTSLPVSLESAKATRVPLFYHRRLFFSCLCPFSRVFSPCFRKAGRRTTCESQFTTQTALLVRRNEPSDESPARALLTRLRGREFGSKRSCFDQTCKQTWRAQAVLRG